MNFQCTVVLDPIKVLVVNSLAAASQLLAIKILSGVVFGNNQPIDIILLVYCNERALAEAFKSELIKCSFKCTNSIQISSELPSLSDADVFCFISNFSNPNNFDIDKIDNADQFDTLYLIIKIANNFSRSAQIEEKSLEKVISNKKKKEVKKKKKPIFIADGLITIDILNTLSINIPYDALYCLTPIPAIAKSVLGEYLKVQRNVLNDLLVWAANDEVFHVEVNKPLVINDKVVDLSPYDRDMINKDLLDLVNLDHTQFSDSWMKKEFIEKVASSAVKNPYGCIYRAAEFATALQTIWSARSRNDGTKVYTNVGVISDGSLGTKKGFPYTLPVIFCGDSWTINKRFEEDTHLRHEIKRINKAVKEHHLKLIPYCKKFLEENVINQAFIPAEDDAGSVFSLIPTDSGVPNTNTTYLE